MRTILLSFILIAGFFHAGLAQSYVIKGRVHDTLNYQFLPSASVVLIRTTDSVIQSHTRSHNDGSFDLKVPRPGRYIIHVTFPRFADFQDVIDVHDFVTNYGTVQMESSEHLLKEFVLKKNIAAIKIKGDTTEYMADSFKVKDNATVEDLLKRLPGITVDKNGSITAQGETVQKVLVDGEEFFSDDPKVVTQGLQAATVEKVQVFDKKSDQAEFTGIDDGQKTKTINLSLKEDKKKGVFGKVEAGGGTDGYFQNQGMLNAFKAKRQLAAFGIMSNTDKVGLGWQDNNSFSSGGGITEINDEGQINITSVGSGDDIAGWDGKYNGEGLPKVWTGGLHFANKWNEDKQHIAGNYRYGMQNVEVNGLTTTQNPLTNDSVSVTREKRNQFSKGDRHGLDGLYEWKIDSFTTLKITAAAGEKETDIATMYNSATLLQDSILSNTNNKQSSSSSTSTFVNTDVLLRKKFRTKGRSFSLDVKENYKETKSDGQLVSQTNLYRADTIAFTNNVNQKKTSATNTLAFSARATYTEPLAKKTFLELNYGLTVNNSIAQNFSYDADPLTGKMDQLNTYYSSDYKYNILTNTGGIAARFVYEKYNFSVGSDVSDARYNQVNSLFGDSTRKYDYLNFFPRATFVYQTGRTNSFRFNYQGSTRQPTITEIAPLKQNTDPLNIVVGNPDLKQQFTHAFTMRYNNFKILSGRYLFLSGNFNVINDAISTSTSNTDGLRQTRYINVDGNYNGFAFLGYGFKLKKTDMQIGAHLNTGINHVNSIINGKKNTTNNNSYTLTPSVRYYKDKKYSLEFNPSITYNDNKSSVSQNSSYWMSNNELSGTLQLPGKLEFNTSFNWSLRQKTELFSTNNNVMLWNAYLSRKFLKKSNLELRASVFDILNQNIGYSRTAQAGIITEDAYNSIRRYGMMSFIWNFSSMPGGAPPPSGPMMMMRR